MTFDAETFLTGLFAPEPALPAAAVGTEATMTVADLPEPWREHYEHRAAVREYEGGQAREHAAAEALAETLAAMRRAGQKPG